MNPSRVFAACLVLGLASACASSRQPEARPQGPDEERAAAERQLRRMFPGIEGPITREAIAAEIADETERELASRDASAPLRAGAIAAIEQGDFDRARDLLSELLAGHHVERARALAEAGDAKGALAALDRALEMAPRSTSILCSRGEAALAAGAHDPALLESALANFLAAAALAPEKSSARAWLGASRAARGLGHLADAREHARRGLATPELEAGPIDALQRALAEATFDEYLGAKNGGAAAEKVRSRARESQDALEGLLGRVPEDPWSWTHLAELAEFSGAHAEARDIALRGLRIAPDDASLLESLASATRGAGGATAAVAALAPYTRLHPEVAAGVWQLALALYDQGVEDAAHARDPRQRLADAEAAFARCRGLDAREDGACRALEAQCRGALASWLLAHDDLPGAHRAFVSMQDASKNGLELEIRGTGARGVDGLFQVAERYAERGNPGNPGSIDSLEQAARICGLLHEVDPKDARFAAAAGRFLRDAAIAIELEASALGDPSTAQAEQRLARARELMQAAYAASRDAAALVPDDERLAAQAGAILVRYLQREPEAARTFLERAVALGETRVAALAAAAEEADLAAPERQARRKRLEDEQALVGDACKDLGLVHLEFLGDPAHAREWFEKSRKAGPDPRPEIDGLIERCEKARKGELDPRLPDEDRWAPPARSARKPS